MKTASVRELRSEFPKVMAWVDAGEDVVITKRHKVVARLSPATPVEARPKQRPDFAARRKKIFGGTKVSAKAMTDILDDNRGRY